MTRINTNVSSLNAQKTLARSNAQLQQALTRLSTGLRINSGKDDPAGLIASETLKADITSTNKAISNSQRANQMITTADSALGQISSLLNDIRGLVSEAANTGAMSAEQIAANQLQIDSSLEAIDRVARITAFQGKRLLDGNLDFNTTGISNAQITDLQIDQATFGKQSQIGVAVDVVDEAEKGSLSYNSNTIADDVVLEIGGSEGYEAFSFAAGSSVSDLAAAINLVSDALGVKATTGAVTATEDRTGQTNLTLAGGQRLNIQAQTAGAAAGNKNIVFTTGAAFAVDVTTDPDQIQVTLAVDSASTAASLGALSTGGAGTLSLTATTAGSAFSNAKVKVLFGQTAAGATYDYTTHTITASVTQAAAAATDDNVAAAINGDLAALFTAAGSGGGAVITQATLEGNTYTGVGSDGGNLLTHDTLGAVTNRLSNLVADAAFAAAYNLTVYDTDGSVITPANWATDATQMLSKVDYSASYGQENVGLASDANNGIELLGTEGTQYPAINFIKSSNNQPLTITYSQNSGTDGHSTAYLQGTGAVVKIASTVQGTQYDGIAISFVDGGAGSDPTAIYNAATKTLQLSFDAAAVGATVTGNEIADMINKTGLFEATIIGDGTQDTFLTTQTATTSGGNPYSAINVNLATDANGAIVSTAADVINAINNSAELKTMGITAANLGSSTGTGIVSTGSTYLTKAGVTKVAAYASGTTYAASGTDGRLTATAKTTGGAYDGVKIKVYDDATVTAGVNERITYDANKKELALYVDSGNSTVNDVLARFNATNYPTEYAMFSLSALGTGTGVLTAGDEGVTSGGMVDSGAAVGAVGFVENIDQGDQVGETLQFISTKYGADQFVHVTALKGTFTTYNAEGQAVERDAGKDINVRINGISAVAEGLNVAFNTSSLDMRFTMDENVTQGTRIAFDITGGGAQFQLGPDVLSNQQARIGISAISTVKLGGDSGRLYELRSGGSKALNADTGGAAAVVEEVITQITNIRGRLGAFQKTTLDTNIAALTDTVETLTQARSDIEDTDFAAESAAMTRANILVQSGLTVLSTANQNPQNVLKLLQQ